MLKTVFLLLISLSAFGEIPAGLLSVDKILEEIKLPLNNKIIQMRQNFSEIPREASVIYTSQKVESCLSGVTVAPGEPILKVVTQTDDYPIKRTIKTYYGCSQEISFREITTEEKESFRYELFGPSSLAIFSLLRTKDGKDYRSEISLSGQKIYLIQEIQRSQYDEVFYFRFPFRINFNLNGYRLNFNNSREDNGNFLVRNLGRERLEFFSPSGERLSRAQFIENTQFRGINYFVDAVLQDLPETKFINSGNRNQKLVEELRNAQTFLLSNTNIDYVKNLINEYIKLAQEGELQDNR